jgi:hypothetical protein
MDACPPLEDIAAFIDGMLSPAERERMTAHLARCESCYEVFAGAVEFQEESSAEDTTGRGVLPFPLVEPAAPEPAPAVPLARRQTRWFPLAASIVLTAGVGFFAWQAFRSPQVTLDSVAGMLKDRPGVGQHLYEDSAQRGGPEEAGWEVEPPEFMAGVYLLDLRLSGSPERTASFLQKLGNELRDMPLMDDLGQRYTDEYVNFRGSEDRQLESRLLKLEADALDRLHESRSFSFGLWAEGGRLSAATRSPEFFKDRNNRRFLSLLEKDLPVPEDLHEQVLGDLQVIENRWGKDFPPLEKSFGNIIKAIDGYEEEFPAE